MIATSPMEAGLIGYLCAAAAYLVLTVLVMRRWTTTLTGLLVALASAASCLWAALTAYDLYADATIAWGDQLLEILRSCLWSILPLSMLYWLPPTRR